MFDNLYDFFCSQLVQKSSLFDIMKGSNTAPSQTAQPVYEMPDVNPTPSALNLTISDPQSGCQDENNAYDYVERTSMEVTHVNMHNYMHNYIYTSFSNM